MLATPSPQSDFLVKKIWRSLATKTYHCIWLSEYSIAAANTILGSFHFIGSSQSIDRVTIQGRTEHSENQARNLEKKGSYIGRAASWYYFGSRPSVEPQQHWDRQRCIKYPQCLWTHIPVLSRTAFEPLFPETEWSHITGFSICRPTR